MKIAIGSDHGGYKLKQGLIKYLISKRHNVLDAGCFRPERCDYPEYGLRVARLVGGKKADKGILLCTSGIGQSMVANKVKGIRAALCLNVSMARSSREHNDANILVMGARYVDCKKAVKITSVWLKTKALGGRHKRRVSQMDRLGCACL